MLQRNAPLPAGLARHRAGVGGEITAAGARYREGAVAGQQVRPVIEPGLHRPLDQQRAKAGAVDEEIGFQPAVAIEHECRNISGFAVALHPLDGTFGAQGTPRFGIMAQECGIERGVEVIGVRQVRTARPRHAQIARGDLVGRIMRQVLRMAERLGAQPVMAKSDKARRLPDRAKRVHVAMAFTAPAIERDAELEAAFGLAQELGLVDAQRLIEMADLRDRRFAHADRAD